MQPLRTCFLLTCALTLWPACAEGAPGEPSGPPLIVGLSVTAVDPGAAVVELEAEHHRFVKDPLIHEIRWGDGQIETSLSAGPLHVTHRYAAPGSYEVLVQACENRSDGRCEEHRRRVRVGVGEGSRDPDRDGVPTLVDNCPFDANPEQEDVNINGVGDVCDDEPPQILIQRPELRSHPDRGDVEITYRSAGDGSTLQVLGQVYGASDVDVRLNGHPLDVESRPADRFSATGLLNISGPGPFVDNPVLVTATDAGGRTSTTAFAVRVVISNLQPGRLLVRFKPEAERRAVQALLEALDAQVLHRYRPTRQLSIAVDPAVDTHALAATLSGHPAVAYAMAVPVDEEDGVCDPSPTADDTWLGSPGMHALANDATFATLDAYNICEPGVPGDCANPQDECISNICVQDANNALGQGNPARFNGLLDQPCALHTDCNIPGAVSNWCTGGYDLCRYPDGSFGLPSCVTDMDCILAGASYCPTAFGWCGRTGHADYDVGWDEASADVCTVASNGPEVIVAMYEGSLADLNHPELQPRMWVNVDECSGVPCSLDNDCILAGLDSCYLTDNGGVCDGPDADVLPDCAQGEASPGDGCPGLCGDDDGDGFADFADPEVQDLVIRLTSNGLDDDGDGTTDEADEEDLAERDDDENGRIDDIHGFNFELARENGELEGSTHPLGITGLGYHSLMTAGAVAAQLDNGLAVAGVHPRARLMLLGADTVDDFVPASHYAAAYGARVMNMSVGNYCTCAAVPCTGADLDAYHNCITARTQLFIDGLDTRMLYMVSAGNCRRDLTVEPVPDVAGFCNVNNVVGAGNCTTVLSDECRWRFPQNVGTYLDAAGNVFTGGTGSVYQAVVAATDIGDRFSDYYLSYETNGSNFGSFDVDLGNAVDFAAPTDHVDRLCTSTTDFHCPGTQAAMRSSGMTSFATPTASGVAAMVISAFPTTFDGRPILLRERLESTLDPCQAPLPGLRDCTEMLHPGRVDLFNALDVATYPLPTFDPWGPVSFQLPTPVFVRANTKDIRFIDSDLDGDVDFVLRLSGGMGGFAYGPRLFAYDPLTVSFSDVSLTHLPQDLAGDILRFNGGEAAVADFDEDGCTDMVWVGLADDDPLAGLQGHEDRLMLQSKIGSDCTGVFVDVSATNYPVMNDASRDIDLVDANLDGHQDLYVTNARFAFGAPAFPGADELDRLLINFECAGPGTGTWGCFADESAARLPIPLPATEAADAFNSLICDVDADGDPDIVSAGRSVSHRLQLHDGIGAYVEVDPVAAGIDFGVTGSTSDVRCHDWTDPTGLGGPDGYPELVFSAGPNSLNRLLVNDGVASPGTFTDMSAALMPAVLDHSGGLAVCELDGGDPEILIANGNRGSFTPQSNRVLSYDPAAVPPFQDVDLTLGFGFSTAGVAGSPPEARITEEIACGDLDGDGELDIVVFGNINNTGASFFLRQ